MMLFAAIATVLARLVERYGREGARRGWGWTRWMPSPTSAGIAFIVPPPFSVAVAVGAFASGAWAATSGRGSTGNTRTPSRRDCSRGRG